MLHIATDNIGDVNPTCPDSKNFAGRFYYKLSPA